MVPSARSGFGATRWGAIGGILGAIIGLFFGLIGIFVGPLIGALAGELLGGKGLLPAGRSSWGAVLRNNRWDLLGSSALAS